MNTLRSSPVLVGLFQKIISFARPNPHRLIRPRRSKSRTPSAASTYEPLEPRLALAGNVVIEVQGSRLFLRGDAAANELEVSRVESGWLVTGSATTQLNGATVPWRGELPRLREIIVQLEGGSDRLIFRGGDSQVAVKIAAGSGDDQIEVRDGTWRAIEWQGGSGHDSLLLHHVSLRQNSFFHDESGNDQLVIDKLFSRRTLQVDLGIGDDLFCSDHLQVSRRMKLNLGTGDDRCLMTGSTELGNASQLNLGAGSDFWGVLPSRTAETANLGRRFVVNAAEGTSKVVLDPQVQWKTGRLVASPAGSHQWAGWNGSGRVRSENFSSVAQLNSIAELHGIYQNLRSSGFNSTIFGDVNLQLDLSTQSVSVQAAQYSTSVTWDRVAQAAVAATSPGPTIASRAYALLHTAMFNAWSVYEPSARSTTSEDRWQRPQSENTLERKAEAMSYAAYRVLLDLFPDQGARFRNQLQALGYSADQTTEDMTSPAGVGNRMARLLLEQRHGDGSNQRGDDARGTPGVRYSDTSNYQPANPVGVAKVIDRWTPERVPIDATAETQVRQQKYLTPHWGSVVPFGLTAGAQVRPAPPEYFLLKPGVVDLEARTIRLTSGEVLPISRELIGSVINPKFISQAEEVVRYGAELTDDQKLIAEFWEDGRGTSFPPGTWMTFGHYVSVRDRHTLDDDARMFFALSNALMDAGIAVWDTKGHYDSARPVRVIRALGELGLIGEWDTQLGGYAITGWQPSIGTGRMLASEFMTYQPPGGDPSPPFAEYTSGHSGFSAAGAKILELFTGSQVFGASVSFPEGSSRFEPGATPERATTLAWPTFTAAADQAGMSRRYGGIHFPDGDLAGRATGAKVGELVWRKASSYF